MQAGGARANRLHDQRVRVQRFSSDALQNSIDKMRYTLRIIAIP